MSETPFDLGFSMPAEWAKHEATWLSWPTDPTTWPDRVPQAEQVYLQMIEALHAHEKVHLLVDSEKEKERVQKRLDDRSITKNVLLHPVKTEDVWMRDYGPIFVTSGTEVAYTNWEFNSWGNKYEELLADNEVTRRLKSIIDKREFAPGMVLEGGSIDGNGKGTCLTTEECLLNKNRNPELSKEEIERKLHDYLGFTNIIWLGRGIGGDDTDGHVDDFARFVNEDTVLCAVERNEKDKNYAVLKENYERLEKATDQDGKKLSVIPVPMPTPQHAPDRRLAASYLNFYIGNKTVLLPVYKDMHDVEAIMILKNAFPTRNVVPIDCTDFVWGFGALHCVTQQEPTA